MKEVRDKFFAFLKATSLSHGLDREHEYLGHSYGRNCLLLGWSHEPYEEAVRAVHKVQPAVSQKTIGEVLTRSMVRLFHQHNVQDGADPEADAPLLESILPTLDSSAVSEEITSLLDFVRSQVKTWSTFVFVEGVELKDLTTLQLGAATLYPKDHGPLLGALENVKKIKGLENTPQHIETEAGHCRCYLTIDIEGESKYVNQQALHRAQDVVNVLNLYLVSRHRASFYQRIGVIGHPSTTRRQFVFKCTPPVDEGSDPSKYSYFSQLPPARYYEIDSALVQQWRENGLDKALESIELSDAAPRSAESRIRNAITWYGRTMNANTQDEQFVGLTTALESLLVADEDISITQRLADVVSALLGGNFQNREHIKKRTKELYHLRGRIVHAGIPISQENLFALDEMVANTILSFVRREMPSA